MTHRRAIAGQAGAGGAVPMSLTFTTTGAFQSVHLGFVSAGTYNVTVDYGDGTSPVTITAYDDAGVSHIYTSAGTYTCTISGSATHWDLYNAASVQERSRLVGVPELGSLGWTNFDNGFRDCDYLLSVSGGDVSAVTSMEYMFYTSAAVVPDTSGWDTSALLSIKRMFSSATAANPDTSGWDMSNIVDASYAFVLATSFAGDISQWVLTDLENASYMLYGCSGITAAAPADQFWNNANITAYTGCFEDAVNISNYADIPAGWK